MARDTRRWLDDLVMGLNLCPFARPALPGTTVLVSAATTPDALRLELRRELETLRRAPADSARTTLLVIPPSRPRRARRARSRGSWTARGSSRRRRRGR